MIIKLQPKYKSAYVEHTQVKFANGVPEFSLIKALGMLDDGQIESIYIPNHLISDELVKNFFPADIYVVSY